MAKPKILLKTEYYITGVGMVEILKEQLGEELEVSIVYSYDAVKKLLEKEQFDMLIIEMKTIKRQVDKLKFEALLALFSPIKTLAIYDMTDYNFCRWLYMKGVLGVTNASGRVAEMSRAITNVFNGNMHIDNNMLAHMIKLYLEPR